MQVSNNQPKAVSTAVATSSDRGAARNPRPAAKALHHASRPRRISLTILSRSERPHVSVDAEREVVRLSARDAADGLRQLDHQRLREEMLRLVRGEVLAESRDVHISCRADQTRVYGATRDRGHGDRSLVLVALHARLGEAGDHLRRQTILEVAQTELRMLVGSKCNRHATACDSNGMLVACRDRHDLAGQGMIDLLGKLLIAAITETKLT